MKILKFIVFIIVLVLLAGIIYFLVERPEIGSNQNNEQSAEDLVVNLVGEIKKEVGVDFVYKDLADFEWITGIGDNGLDRENISGVLYQADDVKMVDYQKIESMLVENYEENLNTGADGVSGGQRGFIVGSQVCLLSFRHNQLLQHENAPTEVIGDSRTVKLECGDLN